MDDPLNMQQLIPYLALFIDSNPIVAAEAKRLGVTHRELKLIDEALEILSEEE